MPTISVFFGIVIRMYQNDHVPPHFHALYGGEEAQVAIETGDLLKGNLPRVAQRLVKEWCGLHREELLKNWSKARARESLEKIDGLDVE